MLELGCGTGNFSAELIRRFGAHVTGIEYSKEAANVAQKRLNQVYCANLDSFDLKVLDNDFDLIVANDVLEHLIDPWLIIGALREHLSKDGVFITSIPNIRYYGKLLDLLFNDQWKYEAAGILDRTHLRFFTKTTIKEAFMNNGYAINGIWPINTRRGIKKHIQTLKYALSPGLFAQQFVIVARPINQL